MTKKKQPKGKSAHELRAEKRRKKHVKPNNGKPDTS